MTAAASIQRLARRGLSARRRGMTLVEILVAMLILSLGATSLIALFASASANHKRSIDRTHAALVAEELFSEVQARYLVGVEPDAIVRDLLRTVPSRIGGYYWEVTLHRPGAGDGRAGEDTSDTVWTEDELVVRVVVRWSLAEESGEESYVTILLPRPR